MDVFPDDVAHGASYVEATARFWVKVEHSVVGGDGVDSIYQITGIGLGDVLERA